VGAFRAACARLGACQSMGRPGSALDNAVIESWHSTLEFELRSVEQFATRAAARARVAAWIEDYNHHRRHSACQMMSPAGYERALAAGRRPEMALASPPPSLPRCSPLSRSFLSGHGLRFGVTWQRTGSKDSHDQLNQGVYAFRGTPPNPAALLRLVEPVGVLKLGHML
jgi:hypothetical protein